MLFINYNFYPYKLYLPNLLYCPLFLFLKLFYVSLSGETPVTCTAGVGTFIVEFGALSRLTGDSKTLYLFSLLIKHTIA